MPRYKIHGRQLNDDIIKIFEADSGDDARRQAQAIGLDVVAVEVLEGAPPPPMDSEPAAASRSSQESDTRNPLSEGSPPDPRDLPEREIWQGSPSQWTNFWWYLSCILVIPIPIAIWKALSTAKTDFSLTTQRLMLETGVFTRELEEIELYRIKDTQLRRSFIQRMVGLGTVTVVSSDETMPTLLIPSIKDPVDVRQKVRENVEFVRRARGVRELDMN